MKKNLPLGMIFAVMAAQAKSTFALQTSIKIPRVKKGNKTHSYPFSSARQDARSAKKYYTTTVNGFEVMQSRSSKEIAARELKLAA